MALHSGIRKPATEYVQDLAPTKVIFVGFSTDRHHLLVHDLIGRWTVWDSANGRQISFPDGAREKANFIPTGEVFGASVAGASMTWDVVTGTSKRNPKWQSLHRSFSVISTNGRVLAAADPMHEELTSVRSYVRLEEATPRKLVLRRLARIDADGRALAAPGPGQTVKLWDVATGEESMSLEISPRPSDFPLSLARRCDVGRVHGGLRRRISIPSLALGPERIRVGRDSPLCDYPFALGFLGMSEPRPPR